MDYLPNPIKKISGIFKKSDDKQNGAQQQNGQKKGSYDDKALQDWCQDWTEVRDFITANAKDVPQEKIDRWIHKNNDPTFLKTANMDPKNKQTPQINIPKAALTSYPRSGNTMIRKYLERLTRIYTGSDCDLKRRLNRQLYEMGMIGEALMDDSVLVVKSHYPERNGMGQFDCKKVIVITRHPLDCMTSLFNMIATTSHSDSIEKQQLDKPELDGLWKEYVLQEPPVWNAFHDFWFKQPQKIYTHIIRFEDILYHPRESLSQLLEFILECPNGIEGLVIDSLIEKLAADLANKEGQEHNQVYKPRNGKVGANLKFYDAEQLKYIGEQCGENLAQLGYVLDDSQVELCEKRYATEWIQSFNQQMLENLIKNKQSNQELFDKQYFRINDESQILRKKSENDPQGRGARVFKKKLAEIMKDD